MALSNFAYRSALWRRPIEPLAARRTGRGNPPTSGGGLLPDSGQRDNRARRWFRLGRQASTTALLPQSCVVARTGRPRRLWLPRLPPAPCPQGSAWRVKRDWPRRGCAPGAWQVVRCSSAGRHTTRRNDSPAGSPGGIAGMDPAARSWSPCPPSPVRTIFSLYLCAPTLCRGEPPRE